MTKKMLLIHGKMFGFIRCYGRRVNEDETGLLLNINLNDNALTLDLPLEVLEYFRLDKPKALKIIDRIKKSVSNWLRVAIKYQLPKSEQEIMEKVFERFL